MIPFRKVLAIPEQFKMRVSSHFGNRTHPVTGEPDRFHNGIDVPAVRFTAVHSPWDGTVAEVWNHEFGGVSLRISHDNGYTTGYAHLEAVQVSKGQKVKAGDKVALSGNTGRSGGPHLHFTLRDKSGTLINPLTQFKVS